MADQKPSLTGDTFTGKVADELASKFLRFAKSEPDELKLHRLVIRTGICQLVNSELARRRSHFKSDSSWAQEKLARRRENARSYAAARRERVTDDTAYAEANGIPVAEVYAHRQSAAAASAERAFAAIREAAEDMARKRAADILNSWLVGNCRLADLTGTELARQSQAEDRKVDAHRRNAQFYRKLAAMCPPDTKLGTVVDHNAFLSAFDECFSDEEASTAPPQRGA